MTRETLGDAQPRQRFYPEAGSRGLCHTDNAVISFNPVAAIVQPTDLILDRDATRDRLPIDDSAVIKAGKPLTKEDSRFDIAVPAGAILDRWRPRAPSRNKPEREAEDVLPPHRRASTHRTLSDAFGESADDLVTHKRPETFYQAGRPWLYPKVRWVNEHCPDSGASARRRCLKVLTAGRGSACPNAH